MKVFSIDSNDHIRVENSGNVRAKEPGRHFTSDKEWNRIGGEMPMSRLVGIWNALAGVTPVQRFTSREKALRRIWKALENIEQKDNTNACPTAAMVHPAASTATAEAGVERRHSKKAQLLALLKMDAGVSLDQLARVTGWQKHSIRGFLSGTIRKQMGLKLITSKDENGARIYRIHA